MKARVLLGLAVTVVLVFALSSFRASPSLSAQTKNARSFEFPEQEELKDVLKIEIQDGTTADFPKDFDLKVKNLSSKPIYHISVMVEFPEVKKIRGIGLGMPLQFGSKEMIDIKEHAKLSSISLQPGESCVLKPTEQQVADYRKDFNELITNNGKSLSQVRISVQVINYGDGTGYIIGLPYPQKQNSKPNCPNQEGQT